MPRHYVFRDEALPPPPPPSSQAEIPSSPSRRKTRSSYRATADPTVTPKRFKRFFTPVSQRNFPMTGRNILGSLDVPHVVNCQLPTPDSSHNGLADPSSSMLPPSSPIERMMGDSGGRGAKRKSVGVSEPVAKRRGIWSEGDNMPKLNLPPRQPSLLEEPFPPVARELGDVPPTDYFGPPLGTDSIIAGSQPTEEDDHIFGPIRRFRDLGLEAQLLDREHGYSTHPSQHYLSTPTSDFRHISANFYSADMDTCNIFDVQNQSETVLPFSLAAANGVNVTAIGDERGNIHYFNTTKSTSHSVSKITTSLNVHNNAIFDLSFSHDDMRIAAGSGNRTINIHDVVTGELTYSLQGHRDSLRQVKFQPSSSNILASSDKLGRIQICDLRCSPNAANNVLDQTHLRPGSNYSPASVTSLLWMAPNRDHLLLSASDASTSVKLWDTRFLQSRKSASATPLSTTMHPPSHSSRHYGVTSLACNTQGDRLYAVSKDNNIYVYSTEHLICGTAPELIDHPSQRPPKRKPTDVSGMGPLYALRHDDLRVGSFYVKASLRPMSKNQSYSELLAVGNTRGKAILFPTDERYLSRANLFDPSSSKTSFTSSQGSFSDRSTSLGCPIYSCGTPLIRGHSDREVTAVSWTRNGELVTGGDDRSVRQWHEDDAKARELRTSGEFGGVRFNCGWADVAEDWDEDEW